MNHLLSTKHTGTPITAKKFLNFSPNCNHGRIGFGEIITNARC
jgi:hypothetical protein